MFFSLSRSCILVGLLATPLLVQAGLSADETAQRLALIGRLSARGIDTDALRREVGYDSENLSLRERARLEALLMFSRVRSATLMAYQNALEETNQDQAAALEMVRGYIQEDLQKFDPSVNDQIRAVADEALSGSTSASQGVEEISPQILSAFEQESLNRQAMLQIQMDEQEQKSHDPSEKRADVNPSSGSGLSTASRGVRNYPSEQAMVNALVSGDESERWVATANFSVRGGHVSTTEGQVSLRLKAEFLGSEISFGPTIKFTYENSSAVDFKAEGAYPVYDSAGNFDLNWHARGSSRTRRFAFFTCETEMRLEVKSSLAGGSLKVVGVGASGEHAVEDTLTVTAQSRRVLIPDSIGNRLTNVSTLARICHTYFSRARAQNGRTVSENLKTQLLSAVASIVYTNPSMMCVRDAHCNKWFNDKWRINRMKAVPRCVQAVSNSAVMTCQTRGQEGASCPVYQKGQKVSVGWFEHTCDKGYHCVTVVPYIPNIISFLPPNQYAIGTCQRVP